MVFVTELAPQASGDLLSADADALGFRAGFFRPVKADVEQRAGIAVFSAPRLK